MRSVKQWLLICLLIEIFCVTYVLKFVSLVPMATILYTLCGIAISFFILYVPEKKLSFTLLANRSQATGCYQLLMWLFGGLVMYIFTKQWIIQSPLSYSDADMIPIMQVMSQRFLEGHWSMVYQPVQEIWNGIQPIYLPAMWMPFLVSVKFGFDPRWITSFGVFLSFSIFILLWRTHWQKISGAVLLFAAGILCLWLYTDATHNFIRLSEEGIVVFYYSLLVLALLSENFLLIGIAAAFCVLSRYAIAGWLPAVTIYLLLIRKQKKDTIQFFLSFATVILLLVILPFGLEPIRIAVQQPEQYMQHATRIWKEAPEYFVQSMGFAKFFGPEQVTLQHEMLLVLSFLAPLLFMLVIKYKNRHMNRYNNIALAALKLSIVVVYTFIDVPYQYLFYTSSFISLIAIAGVSGKEENAEGIHMSQRQ